MDQLTQQYIQQEVQRQLKERDRFNAGGKLFDPNTGLHTQGKNVTGLLGSRADIERLGLYATDQTIASGVIKATSSHLIVYTESAAASDDLDTIIPSPLMRRDELLIIRAGDDGDTVVVKDGTGNLNLESDFSLDTDQDLMILRWDSVNDEWREVVRYDSSVSITSLDTRLDTVEDWGVFQDFTPTWTASGTNPSTLPLLLSTFGA